MNMRDLLSRRVWHYVYMGRSLKPTQPSHPIKCRGNFYKRL